jgi:large subunit ribosomal protein L22
MGARKHRMAEKIKEAKKTLYVAKLNNNPTSPRKTRYTADLIRGVDVEKALAILKFSHREAAPKLHKLLRSAISNWQNKNEGLRMEDAGLFVKEIFVDGGAQLKRLRTAPQGRGYRIRKRSNHVTLTLGARVALAKAEEPIVDENGEVKEKPVAAKKPVTTKKPAVARKPVVTKAKPMTTKRPVAAKKPAARTTRSNKAS